MTPRERAVQVRLTEEEYERLQQVSKNEGFVSVSAFVRSVTVGDKRGVMLQIQDDVKTILKKLDDKEKKGNAKPGK
jgi:hypothetical protein